MKIPVAGPANKQGRVAGRNAALDLKGVGMEDTARLRMRYAREYDTESLAGAVNIPLEDLRERLAEVPQDRPVVVHCSVGHRSYLAQQILQQHGWTNVRNLYGGFAFASEIDWQE